MQLIMQWKEKLKNEPQYKVARKFLVYKTQLKKKTFIDRKFPSVILKLFQFQRKLMI